MEAGIVGADVVGVLVAGAVLKLDIRELLGDLDRLIHVAVRSGEDELVALLREIFEDRNRARVLLDVLDIVRDHLAFERVGHRLAALVMRPRPAPIAGRPEIDEPDLDRIGGEGAAAEGRQSQPRGGRLQHIAACNETHVVLLVR